MKKVILISVLSLINQVLFSQTIKGYVLDKENKEQLAFASLVFKSNLKGTISNEDGKYKLDITGKQSDTVIVSYVGYKKQEILVEDLMGSFNILLSKSQNQLKEVVINANDDFVYELFAEVLKGYRKDRIKRQSKTFFALQSSVDNQPLEMIEAFYNGVYTNSYGFESIDLKNGRIGLTDFYNQFYISLNTTDLVAGYSPFQVRSSWDQLLPLGPGNFRVGKIKKLFRFEIEKYFNEGEEERYVLVFQPKSKGKYFEGKAFINATKMRLERLELYNNRKNDFVEPINKGDKIDSLDYKMTLEFDPATNYAQLKNVQVDYSLLYFHASNATRKKINTKALFYFYAHNNQFMTPLFSSVGQISDYNKILTIPFNSDFWKENYQLEKTKDQEYYTSFFQKHGVLINHSEKSQMSDYLKSNFQLWKRGERLSIKKLNANLSVNQADKSKVTVKTDVYKQMPLSEMYAIDAQLMLDVSKIKKRNKVRLYTAINTTTSFYFLDRNNLSECYINMYFDLFEIERLKIEKELNEKERSYEEIVNKFRGHLTGFNQQLKRFVNEIDHGKDKEALEKWNKYIMQHLGVDNKRMFLAPMPMKESMILSDSLTTELLESSRLYNQGTGMLIQGNYKKAIEFFSMAIKLEDPLADVYFNRGVAYYYLGEFSKACDDWREAARRKDLEVEQMIEEYCVNDQ